MRLTVNLEDNLYRMVKAHALAEETSLSKAINDLLRRLNGPVTAPQAPAAPLSDFPVSRGSRPFSAEDVHRLEEEEDLRHWNV